MSYWKTDRVEVIASQAVIDAAKMCELPLAQYIQQRVAAAAARDLATANDALIGAGLRSAERQAAKLKRSREAGERLKARLQAQSKRPTQVEVKKTIATLLWNKKMGPFVSLHPHGKAIADLERQLEGWQRGYVADFKGDFYSKYAMKCVLTDQQVWQAREKVRMRHDCADPDKLPDMSKEPMWGEVLVEMYRMTHEVRS